MSFLRDKPTLVPSSVVVEKTVLDRFFFIVLVSYQVLYQYELLILSFQSYMMYKITENVGILCPCEVEGQS